MPKTRAPRPKKPTRLERRYVKDLRALSKRFNAEIQKAVKSLNLDVDDLSIPDFYIDMGVAEARIRAIVRTPTVQNMIARHSLRVRDFNAEDMARVLRLSLDVEPPEVQLAMAEFRKRNVDLITQMGERQLRGMRLLVGEAGTTGMRVETLKKRIQERFAIGDRRAELIARDQTLKFNGQLTQIKQTSSGVVEYIWSTSQDERVRDEHEALHGQRIRWDSPPEPGHPGQDFQCRCAALPVLPS